MPVGANVRLMSMRPNRLGWLVYGGEQKNAITVKSDPQNGTYTFTGVYGGNLSVTASNAFKPSPVSKSGSITTNGQVVPINLTLVDKVGSISGTVLNPDSSPVGAGVTVTVTFGGADVIVSTDEAGHFQFTSIIPAGTRRIIAEDKTTTYKNLTYVSVPRGGDVPVTIRLLGKGSMTVKVLDGNGKASVETDVSLRGSDYPNGTADGKTGGNGEVVFTNLTEGRYAVSAKDENNLGGRSEGTVTFDSTVSVTVRLTPSGTVTGRFLGPDGTTPIKGGQVKLKNMSNHVLAYAYSSTDDASAGVFTIDHVPVGDFKLEAFDPITDRRGVGGGRVSYVNHNATADVIVIPRGTVRGTVLNNAGTSPIDNASVRISVSGVQSFSYNTVTAPDGGFVFAGVPAGTFAISAHHAATNLGGSTSGRLIFEEEVVQTEIRVQSSGSIEGVVVRPDGVTLAQNVGVCLSSIDCANRVLVDANGRYGFTDLHTGRSYTVYAAETGTLRAGKAIAVVS